jgi:phage baseplate assembly protein W
MSLEVREFKDLDLNFRAHPVTGDVVRKTGNAAVIAALRNLVLTNRFEKPFRPLYGGDIRSLLFENISPMVANILEAEISNTIKNYEPRVNVLAVRAQANSDKNGYNVAIKFSINNVEEPLTVNMFLQQVQ